jgi:hypothetical protein
VINDEGKSLGGGLRATQIDAGDNPAMKGEGNEKVPGSKKRKCPDEHRAQGGSI